MKTNTFADLSKKINEVKRVDRIFENLKNGESKPIPVISRGDIYIIYESPHHKSVGSEIHQNGRPAVVVSDNFLNNHELVLEVIFLTTQPKNNLPTHTIIYSSGRKATTICEQISSVEISRFGDKIGQVTELELRNIEVCLLNSLGFSGYAAERKKMTPKSISKNVTLSSKTAKSDEAKQPEDVCPSASDASPSSSDNCETDFYKKLADSYLNELNEAKKEMDALNRTIEVLNSTNAKIESTYEKIIDKLISTKH